jgi:hypothetical protein
MKMRTILLFTLILLLPSCEKDNNENEYFNNLKGTWKNLESDFDALIFQNDSSLDRKNLIADIIYHHYKIMIGSDTIEIKYNGLDKIEVLSSKKKYYLDSTMDTLVIENLSKYYPHYNGEKFYRLKNK